MKQRECGGSGGVPGEDHDNCKCVKSLLIVPESNTETVQHSVCKGNLSCHDTPMSWDQIASALKTEVPEGVSFGLMMLDTDSKHGAKVVLITGHPDDIDQMMENRTVFDLAKKRARGPAMLLNPAHVPNCPPPSLQH